MRPEIISWLCMFGTFEPLCLASERALDESAWEGLTGLQEMEIHTGNLYCLTVIIQYGKQVSVVQAVHLS